MTVAQWAAILFASAVALIATGLATESAKPRLVILILGALAGWATVILLFVAALD